MLEAGSVCKTLSLPKPHRLMYPTYAAAATRPWTTTSIPLIVIATLFDACRIINQVNDGNATLTAADIEELKDVMRTFLGDILGIRLESGADASGEGSLKPFEQAIDLILSLRKDAKSRKDWATSDRIRDELAAIGFAVKDTKDGGWEWSLNK